MGTAIAIRDVTLHVLPPRPAKSRRNVIPLSDQFLAH
jgi:hypothetical protein